MTKSQELLEKNEIDVDGHRAYYFSPEGLKAFAEAVIEDYQAEECGCDGCQTCLDYKTKTMNKLFEKEETDD